MNLSFLWTCSPSNKETIERIEWVWWANKPINHIYSSDSCCYVLWSLKRVKIRLLFFISFSSDVSGWWKRLLLIQCADSQGVNWKGVLMIIDFHFFSIFTSRSYSRSPDTQTNFLPHSYHNSSLRSIQDCLALCDKSHLLALKKRFLLSDIQAWEIKYL